MVISATVFEFPQSSESITAYSSATGAAAGSRTDALTRYGFPVRARLGIGLAFGFSVHRFSQFFYLCYFSYHRKRPKLSDIICKLTTTDSHKLKAFYLWMASGGTPVHKKSVDIRLLTCPRHLQPRSKWRASYNRFTIRIVLKIPQEKTCATKRLVYISSMICKEQIHMRLHLEESAESPDRLQKSQHQNGTSKSPEDRREYMRKWRSENRDRCRNYSRQEYLRNYDRYRSRRGTEEYKKNLRDYMERYRAKYPDRYLSALRKSNRKHSSKRKAYRQNPENQARRRKIETERYRTDPQYMLAKRLRSRITEAFKIANAKRNCSMIDLVGCSSEHLLAHIESQFTNGMNWENKSSYEIDHKVPMSAFQLDDDEEAKWACYWENLQPLSPIDNLIKHDTIPHPLPPWLPPHIAERIIKRNESK